MIKEIISEKIAQAIKTATEKGELGQLNPQDVPELIVEKTKNPEFGDYAVNISPLAKFARLAPQKIAEAIVPYLDIKDIQVSVIAGFINFKLGTGVLSSAIAKIIKEKENFGRNNQGNGEKVLLEYVSANPTGPLHIGHGRWAAVGSSLANLLKFSGYDVKQEFYINDAGNQINNLGKSLYIRVLQESGIDAKFPESEEEGAKNYYTGDYLIDVAKKYLKTHAVPQSESEETIKGLSDFAKAEMLEIQKKLLAKFKTEYENWYTETSLHQSEEVEKTIEKLKNFDRLYEKDGALWFKSTEYGDDQDRVIIKNDGSYTYLTADIAYHYDKINRGFDRLINIWGADHHGYVARIKASIEAMGKDSSCLEVLLGQLVNLIISGEQVRMGKRRKMLTLEDLIEEVGVDATRFWMIMRSIDTTLDFDVDLAKSCSDENPVFYVQYAHARACSILRTATGERFNQETKEQLPPFITQEELARLLDIESRHSEDFSPKNLSDEQFKTLSQNGQMLRYAQHDDSSSLDILNSLWKTEDPKEIESTKALVLKLESFEDLVQTAAKLRTPYMIARYAQELAKDFHHFYTFTRVLNVEDNVMKARLMLVSSVKQILANALELLGVSAPQSM